MTYIKQTWIDQEGQVRYSETTDGDYKIFTPNYEEVTEIGTPVNALHMNHIEQGIYDCYEEIDTKIVATLNAIYPVGSIYISLTNSCPLSSLFGTWQLITGGLTLQQANVTYPVGTEIPAGLPNIKGSFTGLDVQSGFKGTDAFYVSKKGNFNDSGGDYHSNYGKTMSFDASRVSTIYSDDISTVQPPALAVNIWRRVA